MLRRAALLLLLTALPLAAQPRYEAELLRLEQFVEAKMKEQQIPAMSIAIVKGDFAWSKGFGLADVENNVRATAESSYRMASVTKPMTAAAVLKLVEQGKIDLDAEVQTYVPDFPKKAHPVTIRQLLGHLGGISHYRNYDVEGRIREPRDTKGALAVFQDFDLVAEPGTRYVYSSYGYNLLGAVIEGACKCAYGDFMRDHVWAPLGMTSTRMDDPRAVIPNRVRGYTVEGGTLRNSEYVDISSRFAGGGTRSTVLDMLKFARGVAEGNVLKAETREAMWTSGVTKGGETTRYGFGWMVAPVNGRFMTRHSGSQQETRTELAWFPRERFGFALASNLEEADLSAFAARLAYLFLGDSWNLNYYAGARADEATLLAVGSSWNNGLGYYARHGRAMTSDATELAAAFAYFNEAITSADAKKLAQGRHPAAGEPFVKVGSYIAAQLAKSGADVTRYHGSDLAMFDDYVRLYRASDAIPHRFDAATETRLAKWRAEWDRLWKDEPVRLFTVSTDADVDRLEKEIRPKFAGSSIIPNYSAELISRAERAFVRRDPALATRIATLAVSMYPESDRTTGFAGILAIASGDVERGKTLIAKSRAIAPNGYAANLESAARSLERSGNKEAAAVLRGL